MGEHTVERFMFQPGPIFANIVLTGRRSRNAFSSALDDAT